MKFGAEQLHSPFHLGENPNNSQYIQCLRTYSETSVIRHLCDPLCNPTILRGTGTALNRPVARLNYGGGVLLDQSGTLCYVNGRCG